MTSLHLGIYLGVCNVRVGTHGQKSKLLTKCHRVTTATFVNSIESNNTYRQNDTLLRDTIRIAL